MITLQKVITDNHSPITSDGRESRAKWPPPYYSPRDFHSSFCSNKTEKLGRKPADER